MTTPSENHESYGEDPRGYGSEYGTPSNAGDRFSAGGQRYGDGYPYGTEPYGSAPFGGQEYATPPFDQQPFGQQPFGQHPFDQHPFDQQPYGAQYYGAQYYGAQPYGVQPYGVQPYGSPGYGAVHPYAPNYGATRKEPALSLVLSFFLPGLGTMINGQAGKGIGIMAGYFLGILLSVVLIGIPIMLGFWVWGMVDAYSGAKAHNLRNGFY
ncbi:hypothetical protein G6027_17785 [Dietzia sp. SLG310A2-38A2]|uniref:hypothetical protein n=1 Tax=Dietzia sp. SLG310A2-38A2 TaxID=1630643 RepID=UPI0015FCCADC|nr:hypothetical protein [Dietzia sp. SLG310A2-38A2]MBB1032682.1 hypothetical protein [Dietzia sp. SLG310A2-38A2]